METTVLVTGETGTGKELIARAIHESSARRDRALIKMNCGAIPEDPALLKACAGPGCAVLLLDRSPAGRRRFCSSTVCRNRAKIAAFRERQRAE